jgi:hypothetical protein
MWTLQLAAACAHEGRRPLQSGREEFRAASQLTRAAAQHVGIKQQHQCFVHYQQQLCLCIRLPCVSSAEYKHAAPSERNTPAMHSITQARCRRAAVTLLLQLPVTYPAGAASSRRLRRKRVRQNANTERAPYHLQHRCSPRSATACFCCFRGVGAMLGAVTAARCLNCLNCDGRCLNLMAGAPAISARWEQSSLQKRAVCVGGQGICCGANNRR